MLKKPLLLMFCLFSLLAIISFFLIRPNFPTYSPCSAEIMRVRLRIELRDRLDGLIIQKNFSVEIRDPNLNVTIEVGNATNGIFLTSEEYWVTAYPWYIRPIGASPYRYIESQKINIVALNETITSEVPPYYPPHEVEWIIVLC